MQDLSIEGGCLCSAIRYRASRAPTRGVYCHCRTCQRSSGGLSIAFLNFETGFAFTSGQPRYWRSSPVARRGHCEICGTPIVFKFDSMADVWIPIGSLDAPEAWPMTRDATWGPILHTRIDEGVPWSITDDGLLQLTGEQSPFRTEAIRQASTNEGGTRAC